MKAISSLIIMVGLFSGSAYANYGMAGCGLGQTVMGKKGGQIFAATTNGTFLNQGFGITSGTLGCLAPSDMAKVTAQEQFVADNLNELSKEMARGEGTYLKAFAQTMGCQDTSYPTFATQMQKSFGKIFRSPGAMSVLKTVRGEIKQNSELSTTCNTII